MIADGQDADGPRDSAAQRSRGWSPALFV